MDVDLAVTPDVGPDFRVERDADAHGESDGPDAPVDPAVTPEPEAAHEPTSVGRGSAGEPGAEDDPDGRGRTAGE